MTNEHKDAAVQVDAVPGLTKSPRNEPAQSAPSPRQAVLEAARICEELKRLPVDLSVRDWTKTVEVPLPLFERVTAALRAYAATLPDESEYICKCGIRVVPHRCQIAGEF